MTQNFYPTISKRLWCFPKPFFYTAVLGLAVSFQASIMLSPAHAIKQYSQANGNIACSACHSRTGLTNGTMYPLTGIGTYFKTNGILPPRAAPQPTAPPVYQQQPRPVPPVYQQPQRPAAPPVYQQPPPPPVYQQPQRPAAPPVYQQPYNPPGWRNPQPPPPAYRPQPARNPHVEYCRRKYRSYNISTDTFRGYDGIVRRCISPSSRRQTQPYNPPRRVAPRSYVPPRVVRPRPYTPPPRVRNPVRQSGNYSCNQAKRLIRNQGYNNVTAKNCVDFGRYTFFAYRGGVRYRLRIRASDGVIYKRQRR